MLKTLTEIDYIRKKGLLHESKENDETVIKKTLLDIGNVIDGTFTFGTGITAFLPGVRSLLNGEMPYLSEQSIALIYITAIWIVLNRHGDKVPKLIAAIKKDGLGEVLNKVVTFLKSLEEVGLKVANEVGYAASNIADIGAFTFLAFPILDATLYLIGGNDITLSDPSSYLKSILISIGILSVKNIFNSVIKKIKSRFGTLKEWNVISDDNGMIRDIFQVIKNTLMETSSQTWFIPEELGLQESYLLGKKKYGVELEIGRELKKEKWLLEIRTGKNNNILIDLQINPHYEPRIYQPIYNTLLECISRFNYENHHDSLLVEEDAPLKIKPFLDTENLNISIPLTWDALCEVGAPSWCKLEHIKIRLKSGTPYIITDKRSGEKYLLQHHGKVPMLLDDASFTLYDNKGSVINYKKYFSELPEAIKAFNLEYDARDRIRFSMPFTPEELLAYSNINKFGKEIYKIITTETSQLDREAIISEFLGDKFLLKEDWPSPNSDYNAVQVFSDGIRLSVETYRFEEELNYAHCWFDKNTYSNLMRLFEALGETVHEDCGNWEEGDMDDILTNYFGKKWEETGTDILSEIGYGVGRNRAKEMKAHIMNEELLIPIEDEGRYYTLDLSWGQLLSLIHKYNINNLSELGKTGFNEIETGLSDIWYDTYDWEPDTESNISKYMDDFINQRMKEGDFPTLIEYKNKWEKLLTTIEKLDTATLRRTGYFGNNYHPSWVITVNVGSDSERKLNVFGVDFRRGIVELKDEKRNPYSVEMDDLLPNHILSQPLNFSEKEDTPN